MRDRGRGRPFAAPPRLIGLRKSARAGAQCVENLCLNGAALRTTAYGAISRRAYCCFPADTERSCSTTPASSNARAHEAARRAPICLGVSRCRPIILIVKTDSHTLFVLGGSEPLFVFAQGVNQAARVNAGSAEAGTSAGHSETENTMVGLSQCTPSNPGSRRAQPAGEPKGTSPPTGSRLTVSWQRRRGRPSGQPVSPPGRKRTRR